jgi:predicted ATPase
VTLARGYFLSGKFDQYNRNIAYSAVAEALQALIKQILTETEDQIRKWRENILNVLGSNAQLVIEVVPELEKLIEKQPPVQDLGPVESKNRFTMVCIEL